MFSCRLPLKQAYQPHLLRYPYETFISHRQQYGKAKLTFCVNKAHKAMSPFSVHRLYEVLAEMKKTLLYYDTFMELLT